jgi:DNA-binding MarR family transcriptional regulator
MAEDSVASMLTQYEQAIPGLDLQGLAVGKRVARITAYLGLVGEAVLAPLNLDPPEFDVLSTLLRAGPPYTLTPTALVHDLFLSSGGMTKRLDKLESRHLIKRTPSLSDRRSLLVTLTASGRQLAAEAVHTHAHAITAALRDGSTDLPALADALSNLLHTLETPPARSPAPTTSRPSLDGPSTFG